MNLKTIAILGRRVTSIGAAKNWLIALKIGLPISIMVFLIWQFVFKLDSQIIWEEFINALDKKNLPLLVIALLLTPINWCLELLKWKMLVDLFQPRSFIETAKSILSGICCSIITPHRIGEYAGRLLGIKKEHTWKAIFSTGIAGFAQNFIILLAGLLATNFLFQDYFGLQNDIRLEITIILSIVLVLLFACLLRFDLFAALLGRTKLSHYFSNFHKGLAFLERIPSAITLRIILFSLLRFIVYSLQFYLLLLFFGIEIPFWIGLSCISIVFLIQSGIPLPAVANLFARSEIAIFIFGFWAANELSVICSTLVLWIINLLIPALLGLIFIETSKITRYDELEMDKT